MKLRNLLIAGTAAIASYLAVSHKKEIQEELSKTKSLVQDTKNSYQDIQEKLALIQSYKEPIQEMTDDLQHKLAIFQNETQSRLQEIQKIQDKYTKTEK